MKNMEYFVFLQAIDMATKMGRPCSITHLCRCCLVSLFRPSHKPLGSYAAGAFLFLSKLSTVSFQAAILLHQG